MVPNGDLVEVDNYVDLDTVLDIMSKKYIINDRKLEMEINFRLFDVENSGFITLDNLKYAINHLKQDSDKRFQIFLQSMDDEVIKSMIEEFDKNVDGMISME